MLVHFNLTLLSQRGRGPIRLCGNVDPQKEICKGVLIQESLEGDFSMTKHEVWNEC